MNVVGLSGKMGSGKDFVQEWFNDAGYTVIRRGFADAVRNDIETALGGMHLGALWSKPYTPEIRSLMQWWGTDFRRAQNPEYWIDATRQFLNELAGTPFAEGGTVFLTDMRFENEIQLVKEFDGQVWRIWAPDSVRRERLNLKQEDLALLDSHVSESGLDHYPHWDVFLESTHGKLTPLNPHSQDMFARIVVSTDKSNYPVVVSRR